MPFRDFDAFEAELSKEPIEFELGGRKWVAAHVNAANFLAFTRQLQEGGVAVLLGFESYLTQALPERDREAFAEMLRARDIRLQTLMAVVNWLVEQASGSPFDAASSSPVTPSPTGEPLRVVSPSKASTSRRSPSAAASS